MILPDKIEIQITNRSGVINPIKNIMFGLKVYADNHLRYNYPVMKTDYNGSITLTRQKIIDGTEIKHDVNNKLNLPTKFELYVWSGDLVLDLIKSTKHILELYEDNKTIHAGLLNHGIREEDFAFAIELTREKSLNDRELFNEIKDAINDRVVVYTDRVEDVWIDASSKQYQFIIETKD